MSKKNNNDSGILYDHEHEEDMSDDVQFELEESEQESIGLQGKLKKLRGELQDSRKQSQEYLTGWQKERASFANYKAEEEKKRSERLGILKQTLISDFFPVLDSFEMAFANKDAWEKVDQSWRTGIEYIHSQFMRTLQEYGIAVIGNIGEEFDPMIHEPTEHKLVENAANDHKVIAVIQKGYKAGNAVLRPAKVVIGKYEN